MEIKAGIQKVLPRIEVNDDETKLPDSVHDHQYFDRTNATNKLKEIIIKADLNLEIPEIKEAYEKTMTFLNKIGDIYDGTDTYENYFGVSLNNVGFAFAVHPRGHDYRESIPFFPLAKHLFESEKLKTHQKVELFQQFQSAIPPFILHTYTNDEDEIVGVGLYSPQKVHLLYKSYRQHVEASKCKNPLRKKWLHTKSKINAYIAMKFGRQSVLDSLNFLKRVAPNTQDVGLGAILPLITEDGNIIDSEKFGLLSKVTGHATTVHAIVETYSAVLKELGIEKNEKTTIGIIGLGNIGNSTAKTFLSVYPNVDLVLHDVREKLAKRRVAELTDLLHAESRYESNSIQDVESIVEVFKKSDRIVLAITSEIDFLSIINELGRQKAMQNNIDNPNPEQIYELGLEEAKHIFANKIIFDDSEPGALDPYYADLLGMIGLKPVIDTGKFLNIFRSTFDYTTKERVPYNYGWIQGDEIQGVGIIKAFFGCETEVLFRNFLRKRGLKEELLPGIAGRKVKFPDVLTVRKLLNELDIKVDIDTLQFAGKKKKNALRTLRINREWINVDETIALEA